MGFLDTLGNVLKNAAATGASETDVHSAYDQAAKTVPQDTLAEGLAHAFNSDQTPPFEQMVAGLFSQSSPDQKAGVLNQILATLGPAAVSQIVGAGQAAQVLSGGSVTPQQAQQISPDTVQVLAKQAAKKDSSIVDAAASFYAAHPTLVKTIGAGALAILMSKISQARR